MSPLKQRVDALGQSKSGIQARVAFRRTGSKPSILERGQLVDVVAETTDLIDICESEKAYDRL